MTETNTLELVLSLKRKIVSKPIAVAWPSAERFTSANLRKSRRKGPGLQYLGQKIYDPADGDDPRRIDYNATAAEAEDESGDQDMIIQTFRNPRVVRMNVLLDVNKSMNFGTKGTSKSLLAGLMSGCAIDSARRVNDLASFVTYSFRPLTILKAQGAKRLLTPALVKAIEDRDLDPSTIEGNTVEGGGLALAMKAVSHKASNVVTIVSDFVNMNEDDWEAVRLCGLRHDTIAVYVQDRRERELPRTPWPGMNYRLEDYRGRELSLYVAPDNSPGWFLGALSRIFGSVTTPRQYAENFARHEARILERFKGYGVNALVVSTEAEADAVQNLLSMLSSKMRT
jgi:uncharacterized protein (DUF58 family)